MARLNFERQLLLEPERMNYAIQKIEKLGYTITFKTDKRIEFEFKGEKVVLFPYSGWHTGKSIKDGRGLDNLVKQIRNDHTKRIR